ncbi:MAG: hemolysin family protein [Clostridia bacterium]|nr:hemolysin family protein [Clostridia bacterium]
MDSGTAALQILFLVLLILFSAYFSASETAFSSYNKARMKNDAEDGDKKAKKVLKLSENYEKLISAILIGNNIVNIIATSISTLLFVSLIKNGDLAVTVSTIVMTVTVLIFGEITPKTIAKKAPERMAKRFSKPLSAILTLLTPLTAIFSVWQRFILKVLKAEDESGVTEEEIITVVEEAASGGEIDEQESELIKNVIKFSDLDVNDILTPRVDMAAVEIGWDRQRIAEVFSETEFSRLPVYEESLDKIVGILYQKDFYNDSSLPVSQLIKPVKFIFSSMKISRLLKLFQESKCHMVVVNDEYGGTEGIVTLEDVLESLVGEIYDEHDEVVEDILQISENTYRALGSTAMDKLYETFDLQEVTEDSDITTLSGFAAHQLEKIPEEGDSFEYENLNITITKTDSNRVIESRIVVSEKEEESAE